MSAFSALRTIFSKTLGLPFALIGQIKNIGLGKILLITAIVLIFIPVIITTVTKSVPEGMIELGKRIVLPDKVIGENTQLLLDGGLSTFGKIGAYSKIAQGFMLFFWFFGVIFWFLSFVSQNASFKGFLSFLIAFVFYAMAITTAGMFTLLTDDNNSEMTTGEIIGEVMPYNGVILFAKSIPQIILDPLFKPFENLLLPRIMRGES